MAGAAGILRGQIENWASAKAVAAGYTKEAQQSDSEFIATAWSALSGYERLGDVTDAEFLFDLPSESGQLDVTAHPSAPHRHIVTSDGRELCPAAIWGELSELLHGRAYGEASLWDANCLDPEVEPEGAVAVTLVADAIRVVLRSLRLSAIGLARMRGNVRAEDVLAAALEDLSERETEFDEAAPDYGDIPSFEPTPPAHFVIPPLMHLAPLTPDEGLAPRVLSSLNDDAARWLGVIRGTRPAGRLYRDDELLSIGISWTRWRSAHSAQAALERERLTLGSRFEPSMLRFRATSWIHVTETISMLSLWEQREEARWSLAVLSSSLRSGWWLWLEDDDRSMAMFRFALEQLARARVWRKNPAKAEKLQTRSTPRDWLRAAGLRKLGPMNKALGDFTHQLPWADLEAGRELLVKMQLGDDVSETPFTARRSAAELITALAAEEAVEATTERSAILGSTVRELLYPSRLLVGATDVEDESAVNRVMEQIWTYRGA